MSEDEDERDMTEDTDDEEQTEQEDSTEEGTPDPTLEEQLTELKEKQAAEAVEQVGANIADLEKLLADTKSAEEAYDKAHKQLSGLETELTSERDTVSKALEEALGSEAIGEIKQIVSAQVKKVTYAASALRMSKMAAENARDEAGKAADKLTGAKGRLDTWRKAADSIGKRLKSAETLLKEIKSLRNENRRSEAYWKLALGGHADVPGQLFLNQILSAEPAVIEPDELRGRILAAWNDFRDARRKDAEAKAKLAEAEADLKAKTAALADLTTKLTKAITDALAEREAAPQAA